MPPSPYSVGNNPPTLAQLLAWNDAMVVWAQNMEAWTQKEMQYMQSKGYLNGANATVCGTQFYVCNMNDPLWPFKPGGPFGPFQPITLPVVGGQNPGWQNVNIKLKAAKFTFTGGKTKGKMKFDEDFTIQFGVGGDNAGSGGDEAE